MNSAISRIRLKMDLAITKPLAYYNSCFFPDNEHVTFGLEPEVSSQKNEIPRSSRRMTVMQSAFPALLLIHEGFFVYHSIGFL